jgi:leucyl aminopeptidase
MEEHKADMAGAAVVLAAIKATAMLKVPINLTGISTSLMSTS